MHLSSFNVFLVFKLNMFSGTKRHKCYNHLANSYSKLIMTPVSRWVKNRLRNSNEKYEIYVFIRNVNITIMIAFHHTNIQLLQSILSKWYDIKGILQKYCMVADIHPSKNVDIIKIIHSRNVLVHIKKHKIVFLHPNITYILWWLISVYHSVKF